MSSFLHTLSLLATTWLLWRFIHWLFSKDPLRSIPGPPSKSFLTGTLSSILYKQAQILHPTLSSGSLGQYFSRYGLEFHRDVALNYGPVVRLSGPFGVRIANLLCRD